MNSDRHPNETAERAGFQEHYSVSHARGRIVFLVPSTHPSGLSGIDEGQPAQASRADPWTPLRGRGHRVVSANLPDGSAQSTPGCSVQSPSSPVDSPSHGGPTPGPLTAITRVVSQASLDACVQRRGQHSTGIGRCIFEPRMTSVAREGAG